MVNNFSILGGNIKFSFQTTFKIISMLLYTTNPHSCSRLADDVDAGLLEAEALSSDKSNSKRFMADTLHEVCLIYFRVIKMKVGFRLLPAALEGLGRITHLINMDTVEDLVLLLRGLLKDSQFALPPLIRLLCVSCALKTLSGPGQELQMEIEVT